MDGWVLVRMRERSGKVKLESICIAAREREGGLHGRRGGSL